MASRSSRPDGHRRRTVLQAATAAAAGWWLPAGAQVPAGGGEAEVERLLRAGGVVMAFRHALAPGTFDPPQFRLGDCSTQRNLSDEGRAQARRIGQWFEQRSLKPAKVRSSPWCRCLDTAQLAFGSAPAWPALGSPRGATEATNAASLRELRTAVQQASRARGFEVWVTHMFVLSDLTGQNSQSGEGLVLKPGPGGRVDVLARLLIT
jgi:phosphohistidine phosphatase SixA